MKFYKILLQVFEYNNITKKIPNKQLNKVTHYQFITVSLQDN